MHHHMQYGAFAQMQYVHWHKIQLQKDHREGDANTYLTQYFT